MSKHMETPIGPVQVPKEEFPHNVPDADRLIPRQRLFVDMDGTLAVFTPVDRLETLYQRGYFANLTPIENVVQAVKNIIKQYPDVEVYTLSAVLSDSPYALQEKNDWLNRHLPEIDASHRVFPPCGQDKTAYVPGGLRENDFLLDDYTKNLNDWEPPARGIKLLNGINHTRGTWMHDRIRYDHTPQELATSVVNVMQGRTQVRDAPFNLPPAPQQSYRSFCAGAGAAHQAPEIQRTDVSSLSPSTQLEAAPHQPEQITFDVMEY